MKSARFIVKVICYKFVRPCSRWSWCSGHVKDAPQTQRRRNELCNIPCFECPSAYVSQTGRPFATHMKEHKSAVRQQKENSLLTLHYLAIGHAFDLTRASVVLNGSSKRMRAYIEAWNTTPMRAHMCMIIYPCNKVLREYSKRKGM